MLESQVVEPKTIPLPQKDANGTNLPTKFNSFADKAWFNPKSFESQAAYERWGVRKFKLYVPTSGNLVNRLVGKLLGTGPVKKSEATLRGIETHTRTLEVIHVAGFAVFAGATVITLASGDIPRAVLGVGFNLLGNVYPIMLQRYNRLRLYRIINKVELKSR